MAERISSRFGENFEKGGMEIGLVCAPEGGGSVSLTDSETGVWVVAKIDWDGSISITSSPVYPKALINIEYVSVHQRGQYDLIRLRANLKGEQK